MRKIIGIIGFIVLLSFTGCLDPKNKKTTISIIDNNRHYYPILTGQPLDVIFYIKNTGDNPLLITDIITSCGCLVLNKSTTKNIPAGEEGAISLSYNSTKNVGFAKHWVELYGNFNTSDKMDLVFDVNVVPDANYTKDYEELYQMEKEKFGNIKDMVDGKENNKGYYLEFKEDPTK